MISDSVRNRALTVLWATRDSVQPARVGGRVLDLPLGIQYSVARPSGEPSSAPLARALAPRGPHPPLTVKLGKRLTRRGRGRVEWGGIRYMGWQQQQ